MLKAFLTDAARALKSTGHSVAIDVAGMLAEVEVPDNWQVSPTSPVLDQLPDALAATDCHPAAARLADIAHRLDWREAEREMPKSFVGRYCFAIIVGPDGMIKDDRFNFGTYLQARDTFYPSHRHEAVELYLPLSGTAHWQRGDEAFQPVRPGTLIHHPTYLPHATATLADPLLAIWSWTGNLSFDTYSIDGE